MSASYKQFQNSNSNNGSSKCLQTSTKPSHKTHRYKGSLHNLNDISEFALPPSSNTKKNDNQMLEHTHDNYHKYKAQKSGMISPKKDILFKDIQVPLVDLKKQYSAHLPRHKRHFSAGEDVFVKFEKQLERQKKKIQLENRSIFNYMHVIGRGGFGKVWKVQCKKNGKIFALKQMSKALILAKKSIPSVMGERKLLAAVRSNFLVNMIQSFQDRQNLYLIMDYLPGGDLRHHFSIKKNFTESQAKFIIACIYLGLQTLHQKNIIHRDIKPENIVLDSRGYARITDLGVAKYYRENNAEDTSGTPGYMAPQVLCNQNHTFSVDHFALGIIAYQLMFRKRPYYGRNRKQIRDEMFSKQIQIKKNQIPEQWSLESADFINRLIQRKPNARLGYNNSQQIMNHPWLRQYAWQQIKSCQFTAPYLPICSTMEDYTPQRHQNRQLILQHSMLLREPQVQKLFQGYETKI